MIPLQLALHITATFFDLCVIGLVTLMVIRGLRLGVIRQLTGIAGFVLGMMISVGLVPILVVTTNDRGARTAITFITIIGVGLLMSQAAERIGEMIHKRIRSRRLHGMGAGAGSVVSGVSALLTVWFISSIFLTTPYAYLGATLQRSLVLRALSMVLPPAPATLGRIQAFIDPTGMPQVFVGLEPWSTPTYNVAPQPVVDAAVTLAGNATVRIIDISCGGLTSGSGFVAAGGLVVTNAHVIAGGNNPLVVDENGPHAATPIYFDPIQDIAILRTPSVHAAALKLNRASAPAGTPGVVLGYPDGGPFTGLPAAVVDLGVITGRDIYGEQAVQRLTYTLAASVRPGDSGGPIVLPDGSVLGMMYGRSIANANVGYAVAADTIASALSRTMSRTTAVGTGRCISN